MNCEKFNMKKKRFTQTMKIDDVEISLAQKEEAEDKRKQLHHYKTFKKKQEEQMGTF
jgi:hypothetical protein